MKVNEFIIDSSSGSEHRFSIYQNYGTNKVKELYIGSKEWCDGMLDMIHEALELIQDKVYSEFTEKKFCDFEDIEDEILNIHIGALNFEFVSRDFHDGAGNEVNCECFILGKGNYGITEEKRDGTAGIPYDDEWCLNYYTEESFDFKKTREMIVNEMQEFVISDIDRLVRCVEKDFTWDSLKR